MDHHHSRSRPGFSTIFSWKSRMTSASVPSKWMFVMFLGTFFALFVSRLEDVAIPVTTKKMRAKKWKNNKKRISGGRSRRNKKGRVERKECEECHVTIEGFVLLRNSLPSLFQLLLHLHVVRKIDPTNQGKNSLERRKE
jgi:hypothetical protein